MKLRNLLAIVALFSVGLTGNVFAAFTWQGGGADNNWTTTANWVGGQIANTGQQLIFDGTNTTSVNNTSAFTLNNITFNATAGAFTLSGLNVTQKGGFTDNNSSLTETIDFGGTSTYSTSTQAISVVAGGTLSIESAYGGSVGITKSSGGTLILSGSNGWTGAATVSNNGGSLLIGTGGNISSSSGVTVGTNDTFGTVNTNAAPITLLTNTPTLSLALGTTGAQSNIALNLYSGANSNDEITTSALTLTGSGTLLITLTDTTGNDNLSTTPYLLMTNTGALTQGEVTLAGSALGEGTLLVSGGDLFFDATTQVPEPSEWAMMLGGFALLIAIQRRRLRSL
jgi:fibronectin-binding autotransporter adhesin